MSEWIRCIEDEPPLGDYSVLMHFANGSIETVHVEDFFRQITAGFNIDGEQQYTKWWMKHDPPCTHWMHLPGTPST